MVSIQKCGFIGCGQMASAMISGFVKSKVSPNSIVVFDSNPKQTTKISKLGCIVASNLIDLLKQQCEMIFVCVKPQQIQDVVSDLSQHRKLIEKSTIVSIAAGTKLQAFEGVLTGTKVIRVMPNVNCLVHEAAQGYCLGRNCSPEDGEKIEWLLNKIGLVVAVEKEELLDAVTGLSGSGPAFVFMFIEALADGGVSAGLPRESAILLATQTVLGSAKNVLENVGVYHTAQLKDFVCSPGGTTIRGVSALEDGSFRSTVMKAVYLANCRAKELAAISKL